MRMLVLTLLTFKKVNYFLDTLYIINVILISRLGNIAFGITVYYKDYQNMN